MNLRKAFLSVLLALAWMLVVIGGATLGALSAYNEANVAASHRQSSLSLINEVRHEGELLSRLVSSYVGTANPRFLIYYYDILAVREGSKRAPDAVPASYWEQVIGGLRPYTPPPAGPGLALSERTSRLGFDAQEEGVLKRIYLIGEQMKEIEQIAFAATQGLYDPEKREFVSEAAPQRGFANDLLHEPRYLKLRADLAVAVDELSSQVDRRTQKYLLAAGKSLKIWILASMLLSLGAGIVLVFSFYYLKRYLFAPLANLHRTAQALAEKSFSQRVGNLRGVEEVQLLATTIDSMAAAIEADIEQRELVQRALRQARAKAEVAAEAKSIFLANMSHEIRTPMNAILGMAYLALKSGLSPRQHGYVAKIHEAARSLLGILNDVLDFSKIEAGKVALESIPFDLESVIQNALFMVQQKAEGKRIELILDYQPKPVLRHLLGDPLRLGQVLINLLSNAVKFTDAGHVRLAIREQDNDGETITVTCQVEDTGIGMSSEQVGRMFQEFSQADGSTTRKYGGTGLGLAISKRLVGAMGGELEVESRPGQGSNFHFSVRLAVAPEMPDARDGAGLFCMRALVVDDYPAARESMAEMLLMLGCREVDQASGGRDAVARLTAASKGRGYDLLLLDWLMPDLSGSEVLAALQGAGVPLPMKTIVVSAVDAVLLRQEASQSGISEVIQKPLLPNALRRIIGGNDGLDSAMPDYAVPRSDCLLGMPILLVEDNEVNQQVAGEILRSWGASVDIAENGRIALDRLAAHPPEYYAVVLMDLEMPVMDGREATQRLRSEPRFEKLPVIAMTAHVAGQGMKEHMARGVNGYVAKPFEPDELLAMLQPYWNPQSKPAPSGEAVRAESAESSLPLALAALPGVEVSVLLRRFRGRLPFLVGAMQRFATDCQGWSARLQRALDDGDLVAAERQAHTLKGLAGTFAMTHLQMALLELEKAIKGGGTEVREQIAEVEALLQPLLLAVARLQGEGGAAEALEDTDSPLAEILAVLRRQLSEGDGEAEEFWQANKRRLAELFSPRQIAAIDQALDSWNLDGALAILNGTVQCGGGT